MKNLKLGLMSLFLGLGFAAVHGISGEATAFAKPPHKMAPKHEAHHDKGPCAEIKCEKGDKFCRTKKKECRAQMFQKKMDEAKKNGITADEKTKWVERLEKKLAHKKEKISEYQEMTKDLETNIKAVKALSAK